MIPVICGKLCHKGYAGNIVLKLKTSPFILKEKITNSGENKTAACCNYKGTYDENCCLKWMQFVITQQFLLKKLPLYHSLGKRV